MAGRRLRPMTAVDVAELPPEVARAARRSGWPDAELERWSLCGVVGNGDDVGGWLTLAVDGDAALITALLVKTELRRQGLGRQLVQSAAGLLVRRDVRALEATGSYGPGSAASLPVPWLEELGFKVVRPHPLHPRLRMELQNTVRWRPDLSAAWSRLTGLVTQPPAPEPATYTRREAQTVG